LAVCTGVGAVVNAVYVVGVVKHGGVAGPVSPLPESIDPPPESFIPTVPESVVPPPESFVPPPESGVGCVITPVSTPMPASPLVEVAGDDEQP